MCQKLPVFFTYQTQGYSARNRQGYFQIFIEMFFKKRYQWISWKITISWEVSLFTAAFEVKCSWAVWTAGSSWQTFKPSQIYNCFNIFTQGHNAQSFKTKWQLGLQFNKFSFNVNWSNLNIDLNLYQFFWYLMILDHETK